MFRRIAVAAAVLAAALVAAPRPASAAVATSTLTVSATVIAACTIVPATLDFTTGYNLESTTPVDANVNIVVRCSYGTPYTLALGYGANPLGGTTRRMAGGTSGNPGLLTYELYGDSTRTTAWDNTVARVAGTAGVAASDYTIPLYGRIPAGQIVSPGTYGDTVTMTVNF